MNVKSRINMRIDQSALDEIDAAARLQGLDRTSFMVAAAASRAKELLLQEKLLELTEREVQQLKQALSDDAEPNALMLRAADRLARMGIG